MTEGVQGSADRMVHFASCIQDFIVKVIQVSQNDDFIIVVGA